MTAKKISDAIDCYIQGNHKDKRIKFDRRDKKIYFILAILLSVVFVFELLIVHTEILVEDMLLMPDFMNIIVVSIYYPMIFLTPAAWLRFFDVCLYLKKLKVYGYTVPDDSRVYNKMLEKLPRTELAVQKKRINDSVINTAVSAIITTGILFYNIWFLQEYQGIFLWIFNFAGLVFWIIVTFRYARQISNVKYKDSVELDDTRKTRESLMEAMMGLLLLVLFSIVAIDIIVSVAHVIMKKRLGV